MMMMMMMMMTTTTTTTTTTASRMLCSIRSSDDCWRRRQCLKKKHHPIVTTKLRRVVQLTQSLSTSMCVFAVDELLVLFLARVACQQSIQFDNHDKPRLQMTFSMKHKLISITTSCLDSLGSTSYYVCNAFVRPKVNSLRDISQLAAFGGHFVFMLIRRSQTQISPWEHGYSYSAHQNH